METTHLVEPDPAPSPHHSKYKAFKQLLHEVATKKVDVMVAAICLLFASTTVITASTAKMVMDENSDAIVAQYAVMQ